jgi:hypothetical protein
MNRLISIIQEQINRSLNAPDGQLARLKNMQSRKRIYFGFDRLADMVERMRAHGINNNQYAYEHEALIGWSARPASKSELALLRYFYLQPGHSFFRQEYLKSRLPLRAYSREESASRGHFCAR